MGKLVIINGYAGAGKSTAAKLFANKYRYAIIVQDYFLFHMNSANLKDPDLTPEDHKIAVSNKHQVIENYMKINRNIVLEGALVSISGQDQLDLRDYVKLAKKYSYTTQVVTLIAEEKIRIKRQKKKKHVVPKHIDKMLRDATHGINDLVGGAVTIDTTKLSRKRMLGELERVVG